jgi:glycerophosphoryl diester phosphodiesterase
MAHNIVSGARPSLKEFLADRSWKFAVVAHRGAWHGAPENSIASVELAIRKGYEFVEIDVQATSDGELICLHDDTLERMTGQTGIVANTKASAMTKLPLKQGAGGKEAVFTNSTPALLGDLLDHTAGKIYVDVDVKHLRDLETVADFVSKHTYRSHINLKTLVRSNDDLHLVDALEKRSGVLVKPIIEVSSETLGTYLGLLHSRPTPLVEALFDTWSTFERYANAALSSGTELFLNTLDAVPSAEVTDTQSLANPDEGWGRLIRHGARLLQTDLPESLKAYDADGISKADPLL